MVRWLALRVPTAEPRAQQPRLERQPRGVVCAITIEGCKFITRGVVWAIAIEGCKFITRGVAAVPRRTIAIEGCKFITRGVAAVPRRSSRRAAGLALAAGAHHFERTRELHASHTRAALPGSHAGSRPVSSER